MMMASQSIVMKRLTVNLLFILAFFLPPSHQTSSTREKHTYDNYSLYRCETRSSAHVEQLHTLMMEKRGDGVEFWREPSEFTSTVDIMASPDEQDSLRTYLRISRIPCRTIMHDVGEVIRRTSRINVPPYSQAITHQLPHASYRDASNTTTTNLTSNSISNIKQRQQYLLEPSVFYSNFQPYSIMELKLQQFAKDPRVKLEVAGLSWENRQLYLVKISENPSANKPIIFIDAGHHAREWVSHSTIFYFMESLLSDSVPTTFQSKMENVVNVTTTSATNKSSSDAVVVDGDDQDDALADNLISLDGSPNRRSLRRNNLETLLSKYDFWFVPVVNPDGYEHTHSSNRLWRKTRSRSSGCSGVDPNRNYPFHWKEAGASGWSCDETYAGPRPLSEPETTVVARVLDQNKDRIVMYLTLHAYSQMFLVPYGYGRVYPDNYAQLERVAEVGMRAIASVRGTTYKFGPSAIVLYPAAGGSDDYAYGAAGIKLSYTIELPDTGDYGFLMPPKEIVPIGEETSQGIAAMVRAI